MGNAGNTTKGHLISGVETGSIAEEMGVGAGDRLIAVNGEEVADIFDYRFLIDEEELTLLIEKPDGEEWELEIEKDAEEDPGLVFENGLMDGYRSCRNHCIFCFIDQLPGGMRDTLYFKDDDSRLSFLQGNYVTLTNLSDEDIRRISGYRMSPINISFHTTDPELRCRMLGNRFAGEALAKVDRLIEENDRIELNGQIVLCKGINDGAALKRTIGDLTKYLPHLRSVSVVPVGLTKYRDKLYPLESFDPDDAAAVIDLIEDFQKRLYPVHGMHFIHASDEWYILAGREVPAAETYDGYLQLENGVGMLRLLMDSFTEALDQAVRDHIVPKYREISCASGSLVYPHIVKLMDRLHAAYPSLTVHCHEIVNDFFGEKITVTGLITGRDLIAQLTGRELGERLFLPSNMLRAGEDVLLDDVHLSDIEEALGVAVTPFEGDGEGTVRAFLGIGGPEVPGRLRGYEPAADPVR